MGAAERPFTKSIKSFLWLPPVDGNGNTYGPDRSFVSMRNYPYARVILQFGVIGAGNTTLTFSQAKNVGGNSNKVLGFNTIWQQNSQAGNPPYNQDIFTKTTVAANSYTILGASHDNYLMIVEFKADVLDVTNDFDCIRPNIICGAVSTILSCMIEMHDGKFVGSATDPKIMPSMLIDRYPNV